MKYPSVASVRSEVFAGQSVSSLNFEISGHRNLRSFSKILRQHGSTRRALRFVMAMMLFAVLGVAAQAQKLAPGWYPQSPASTPGSRYIHSMAYDAGHGDVVLFGGFGPGGFLDDTWTWNGTTWTQQSPASYPAARGAQAMVYDAAHGQTVLFGGFNYSSQRLGDTWLWDGTNWTQANPVTATPVARDGAVMVYDAAHSQVMMFGGTGGQYLEALADTWIWNGTNWTELSPANSPSARDDYSMVYDAAHSQVVLFGGEDAYGNYLNDTWTWDGTNWTQQAPANSPPARNAQGMAYDAALGEVVMFGGENASGYLNDTWVWNGTNWTQATSAANPAARLIPNAVVYDPAQSQLVLYGGYANSQFGDTWEWGLPGNFGNANVCPSGQTTPTPCSSSLAFTYNLTAPTAFGNIQVVAQGASVSDFNLAGNTTCNGTVSSGTCSVIVTFTPLAAGLRAGAIELDGLGGNVLATTPIYGVGQAPVAAIGPGTQSTVNTGTFTLSTPKGVLVDQAGNVFISDTTAQRVLKIAPDATVTTVGAGLQFPQGMAEDGAGDLFIADNNLNEVVEVPAGCNSASCQQVLGANLRSQLGVAVDGAGDLFIGDFLDGEVVESPASCRTSACQTVVYSPGAGSSPVGLTVDSAGDLFVADFGLKMVKEVPAGCASSSCQVTVGTGWSQPDGVAVDAAGDVYVADAGLEEIVEIPAGCSNASCQVVVLSGLETVAVAVDAAGDLFVNDFANTRVIEINRSQPPTLGFAFTYIGYASSDSPQSVTLQNVGNQPLNAVNPGWVVNGPNFVEVPGAGVINDCAVIFSLQPANECNLSISFTPQVAGTPLTSTAVFSDNSLNATAAQQTIPLSGSALGAVVTLTVAGSGSGAGFVESNPTGILCNETAGASSGTCSAGYPSGTQVALEEVPSAGSVFTGWGGACASSGASQFCIVTVNAAATATANFALNANYTLSVTTLGSGSGLVSDSQQLIGCTQTRGVSSGTCSGTYASGTLVTLFATPENGSKFLGWGGVCAGSGTSLTCPVTLNEAANATASFVNTSAGSVNVCPAGLTAPAPCSATLPVTFNLTATTTIGAIQVVTQGINGLDFNLGSGSSCTGAITGGSACTVNVNFAPLAPGLRLGAVELFDNNANLVASTPISGIGQQPEIAFGPGIQTTVPAVGLHYNVGTAVDAAGNIFIADYVAAKVVKITSGGVQTTVPATGLTAPIGVAVDGAGNVYIVDLGLPNAVKVTPAGVQTSVGSGLSSPIGIALDGAGDVYISDQNNNRVVEVTPTGAQTPVPATGLNQPWGVAVDAAGDVFIADGKNSRVVEVTPAGVQTTVPTTGLSQPYGVAVDVAGDVYIADPKNARVIEVPAGGGAQITVASGLNYPSGVALDGAGDAFIGDQGSGQVYKLSRSLAPSLSFATTNLGSTSVDSPQAVTVQNVGNLPLTGSVALSLGGNFTQNLNPDCSAGLPLAPGAICGESFSFTPQADTYASGVAVFTDNSLNTASSQAISLSGTGAIAGQAGTVAVPNVIGQTQSAAATPISSVGLAVGTVATASSGSVPVGSIISQNPAAGTQVNVGTVVNLLVSSGMPQPPSPNPLTLENNYFLTGDYVSAGVTLHGTGVGGIATGQITIPTYAASPTGGVPDGADIVDAFLYWETVENTPKASSTSATFNGYAISGQQIGADLPNYTDGALTGTLRAYRADVNAYLANGANGIRYAEGTYTISLPDGGGTVLPLTEGASLVFIYRVLSPNFPLKSVIIYDGSALPTSPTTQVVQGFYDAVGGASGVGKNTNLFASGGQWNNSVNTAATLGNASQFSATLNPPGAYAAVILSTPVNNSDNDGILDAWKAGPAAGDFHAGQPGYYDVKTGSWVGLPGAKHGEKDLFVQLDYMCGSVLADGSCDPTQENLFPSPDANGNDPLAMVQQAFAASGVQLHLQIGNAVQEYTCVDTPATANSPAQLCQFPNQPGVIGWKNSLEFSKIWPRNLTSCANGGDCSPRFAYGQKDSYHYVLMGHSLAIPAWNTRYGTLTAINVVNGITTVSTTDRGTGINFCPSRITLSGIIGNSALNGVYNTTGCADSKTITLATPGVPNWSYPNSTLAEPVIGLTSGTITSISGYSDLGGADSAVTLGLWLTYPNQDMSKRANVLAGTLFHEIGHTLGLTHGGLYYDSTTPGNYVPTFDANCKPNYQSVMNYLFQLDLVGPNQTVAYSNQALNTLNEYTAGSVTQLTDASNNPATFPTSAWYVPYTVGSPASPATLHCDGSPLNGEAGYRVDSSIAPISPAWSNGQDLSFIGTLQSAERGYNDLTAMDLRQVGATGGEFATLANILTFGNASSPLNISAGGNVTLGSGGTIALGSGGTVALGSGGNVTLGSGGTITLGSGGNVTLGSGGNVTLGSGGVVTPGSSGLIALGSGGKATLSTGGTITLGSGGTITLGSGGTVTLGSGGTIALGSGGTIAVPSTGGTYTLDGNGGTITLGSGGNVTLGSGGNITLGSGGTIALGSGGNITLGSGGNVTLGSGGTIALGSGGTIALGSGGNVTLGSGGLIALGSGGTITLGSGGNVTLGSGGTVTLGSGGVTAGAEAGNVSLASGGNVTLGSGGTITLGSGGSLTVNGAAGNITLGSGGTITLGSGGNVTLGSGGTITLGSGGTVTPTGGSAVAVGAGGSYTFGASGGTIALGSGGNITLGSGGLIALGSGGTIALGSGGTITLGSGGNITLGSGGVIALGSGGTIALGSGGTIALGSGGTITLGSGGALSNELTYETANSVVRPPSSPTETPTPAGVRVDWKAPAFGVVQTYTIYRSSDGATPILIGSVSGVNGFPPATEFIDTNPDLTSKTVVYTISTTLVPDTNGAAPRSSAPSVPAVLKNDQSIALGPLPSSVTLANPPVVTAVAMSGGVPNGLQVVFSAAGSCSIGSQSISNNTSSANVTLTGTGSCTVTATQPGSTSFNAANSVSGTFMVLANGSTTQSQTIAFAALPNVQYGNSFSFSASSSAGLPITFTASGPCTTAGKITGVGTCLITASAPANSTYSSASLTQSFTVFPAVLEVTATSLTSVYGQPIPPLTYAYSGFVNNETATVISGVPALSTTATSTSSAGTYPITVSTGSLATANYSFLYVSGALTIQPASQAALAIKTTSPLTYNASETLSATGGSMGGAITYNATGPCSVSGNQLTATSGTGSCQVSATMAGNADYSAVTSPASTVTLALAPQTITFTTNPPANAAYNSSFTVAASAGTGSVLTYTSSGACSNTGATYKITAGSGSCSVIVNAAANANYSAAPQLTKSVTATLALPTVTFTGAPATAAYYTVFTVAATTNATAAAVITSSGACTNVGASVTMTSGTGTCSLLATWAADSHFSAATAKQSTTASLAAQTITFTTNPPATAAYGASFTVAATSTSGGAVAFTSAGVCTNSGATYTMTNSTGACSVIANQTGNGNYAPAPQVIKLVNATGPLLSVSPSSIVFGTVYQGTITTRNITITNTGTAPATINDPILSVVRGGNSDEFIALSLCPRPLAVGKSCDVTIAFLGGPFYTPQDATLEIMSNAPGSPQPVVLSASVIDPVASLNPASLSFGTIKHATSATLDVTLSNPGGTALSLTGITVTGTNATSFGQSNNCGTSLAPGAKCTIAVKFAPSAIGSFNAYLTIVDNAAAGGGTQTIPLSGKGN